MTRFTTILLSLILLLFNSWEYAEAQTLAFPGAEGFGRFTKGGRGGTVIEVTNLNEEGPGSLKAALSASGPRIIVFRVGGTITWTKLFEVKNPFVTIAGQTAPGDGIAIKGPGLIFDFAGTNDPGPGGAQVIVRYIRIRNDPVFTNIGSLVMKGSHSYMVDHVSTSWGKDDQIVGWFARDVTVQWSLIAENVNAGALSNLGTRVSFHHNLLPVSWARSPTVGGGDVDVVNNVVYFQGCYALLYADNRTGLPTFANFVGNYYKNLPNPIACADGSYPPIWMDGAAPLAASSRAYVQGNLAAVFRENDTLPETNVVRQYNGGVQVVGTRFNFPLVTTTTAAQAYIDVAAKAGATLPSRDAADTRVVGYLLSGSAFKGTQGAYITDPSQVGGWPVLKSGTPPADTDHDGMPDAWEISMGLNPNDPGDGPMDRNGDGYTNVEEYLNSIVASSTPTDPTPPAPPSNLQISWSVLGVLFAFLSPMGWKLLRRRRSKSA